MLALPESCPATARLPGEWDAVGKIVRACPQRGHSLSTLRARWLLHTRHVDRVERERFAFLKNEGFPSLPSAFCMQTAASGLSPTESLSCFLPYREDTFQAPWYKRPFLGLLSLLYVCSVEAGLLLFPTRGSHAEGIVTSGSSQ